MTETINSAGLDGLIEVHRQAVAAVDASVKSDGDKAHWDRMFAAEAAAAEALLAHVFRDVAELQRKTRYILTVFTEDTGSSETTVPSYGQLFLEAIMAMRP